jgi:catechol 2,3-dioxygenase-like lactoylglutathione lyase family enzyme
VKVKRVGYVGVRTPELEETTWFFRDVLGLEAAGEDDTVTFTRLPTYRRDLVEVYSPDHRDERMIPNDVDFMIAFVVDDVEQARAEMLAAGLRCGEIV